MIRSNPAGRVERPRKEKFKSEIYSGEELRRGFRLLQLDYLGGHGSRGYGRIAFSAFRVQKMDPKTAEMEEQAALAQEFEGSKL